MNRLALPLAALLTATTARAQDPASLPEVVPHDNRSPAGRAVEGGVVIELEAGTGVWRPERDEAPGLVVHAFAQAGRPLSVPGPLIRVTEGSPVRLRIHNRIAGAALVVHGLHARADAADDTLHVAAGAVREVRLAVGEPGTYGYWATTTGAASLDGRTSAESQLGGAFVVDPRGAAPPADRVFVISLWPDPDKVREEGRLPAPAAVVVNGLSWPHTERFRYAAGDSIRWRWVNLSDRPHPMHLHGSYFEIDSRGIGASDTLYAPGSRPLAATETVVSGASFTMTWVPERAGNWLFHCHTLAHIAPELRRGRASAAGGAAPPPHHVENHALQVMAGLALGIEVEARASGPAEASPSARRAIRLVATADPGRYGAEPGLGFTLDEAARPGRPGPTLVLTRGEPTAITVVNRLAEPTAVHWHGIELESYYDGVAGWSGSSSRTAPAVAPGDSFVAHMTPPRAGTFIYHTHFEELRQLVSGMYGALVVVEPGSVLDPRTDHVLLLSSDAPAREPATLLNGRPAPRIELEAGTVHRIRLVNISANGVRVVTLRDDDGPLSWRPLAKDGADLPEPRRVARPAEQRIGVGETYDFELARDAAGPARIEVRQRGELVLVALVEFVAPRR